METFQPWLDIENSTPDLMMDHIELANQALNEIGEKLSDLTKQVDHNRTKELEELYEGIYGEVEEGIKELEAHGIVTVRCENDGAVLGFRKANFGEAA